MIQNQAHLLYRLAQRHTFPMGEFAPLMSWLASGERAQARLLDLGGEAPSFEVDQPNTSPYSIGRYDERRPALYQTELFTGGEAPRCVHMGLDLGAPEGEPVYAWASGEVYALGALPQPGDYGHSLVTRHSITLQTEDIEPTLVTVWTLYGHLSARSITLRGVGERFEVGARLGELGSPAENGGWTPHLHFQLSVSAPEGHDLPGAVSDQEREAARKRYPDPRLIVGGLYK